MTSVGWSNNILVTFLFLTALGSPWYKSYRGKQTMWLILMIQTRFTAHQVRSNGKIGFLLQEVLTFKLKLKGQVKRLFALWLFNLGADAVKWKPWVTIRRVQVSPLWVRNVRRLDLILSLLPCTGTGAAHFLKARWKGLELKCSVMEHEFDSETLYFLTSATLLFAYFPQHSRIPDCLFDFNHTRWSTKHNKLV